KQSILSTKHVPHYDFNRSRNPIVSLRYFYLHSPLTQLERQIMTIQIELESLKNEKDRISIDRREKLEHSLSEKRKEVEHLTTIWQKEKQQLESLKTAKQELENARINLETALRDGDLRRAAELRYSIIPSLEKAIPPEDTEDTPYT